MNQRYDLPDTELQRIATALEKLVDIFSNGTRVEPVLHPPIQDPLAKVKAQFDEECAARPTPPAAPRPPQKPSTPVVPAAPKPPRPRSTSEGLAAAPPAIPVPPRPKVEEGPLDIQELNKRLVAKAVSLGGTAQESINEIIRTFTDGDSPSLADVSADDYEKLLRMVEAL